MRRLIFYREKWTERSGFLISIQRPTQGFFSVCLRAGRGRPPPRPCHHITEVASLRSHPVGFAGGSTHQTGRSSNGGQERSRRGEETGASFGNVALNPAARACFCGDGDAIPGLVFSAINCDSLARRPHSWGSPASVVLFCISCLLAG